MFLAPLGFLGWTIFVLIVSAPIAIWIPAHARNLAYRLNEENLVVYRGVLYRTQTFVPYSRITDVKILQGPLQRRNGIHELQVQTAGSSTVTASIPGVAAPWELRDVLLERGRRGRSPDDRS
ncbi:MAG: PH domain-containing protein [Thermoplasmata archaeon]